MKEIKLAPSPPIGLRLLEDTFTEGMKQDGQRTGTVPGFHLEGHRILKGKSSRKNLKAFTVHLGRADGDRTWWEFKEKVEALLPLFNEYNFKPDSPIFFRVIVATKLPEYKPRNKKTLPVGARCWNEGIIPWALKEVLKSSRFEDTPSTGQKRSLLELIGARITS